MPLVAQDPSALHSDAGRTFQNIFILKKLNSKVLILFDAFDYFSNLLQKKNTCFYQHKTACVKIQFTKFGNL